MWLGNLFSTHKNILSMFWGHQGDGHFFPTVLVQENTIWVLKLEDWQSRGILENWDDTTEAKAYNMNN